MSIHNVVTTASQHIDLCYSCAQDCGVKIKYMSLACSRCVFTLGQLTPAHYTRLQYTQKHDFCPRYTHPCITSVHHHCSVSLYLPLVCFGLDLCLRLLFSQDIYYRFLPSFKSLTFCRQDWRSWHTTNMPLTHVLSHSKIHGCNVIQNNLYHVLTRLQLPATIESQNCPILVRWKAISSAKLGVSWYRAPSTSPISAPSKSQHDGV